MTFIAIDKHGIGTYITAEDWIQAENICICNGLELIGEVIIDFDVPQMN
jgi:hypothetical protein